MIQLTLTFTSLDAARKALLEIPESVLVGTAPVPEAEAPKSRKAAATPAAVETKAAKPEPAVESPSDPKPAAEPTPAPVVETKSSTASSVDYSTLQKAVFTLAGKSREAAAAVAQSFGVKTFKDLPADKWADALEAVQERLAIVEA